MLHRENPALYKQADEKTQRSIHTPVFNNRFLSQDSDPLATSPTQPSISPPCGGAVAVSSGWDSNSSMYSVSISYYGIYYTCHLPFAVRSSLVAWSLVVSGCSDDLMNVQGQRYTYTCFGPGAERWRRSVKGLEEHVIDVSPRIRSLSGFSWSRV